MQITIEWDIEIEQYRVCIKNQSGDLLTIETTEFLNFARNRALAAQRVLGVEIIEE